MKIIHDYSLMLLSIISSWLCIITVSIDSYMPYRILTYRNHTIIQKWLCGGADVPLHRGATRADTTAQEHRHLVGGCG